MAASPQSLKQFEEAVKNVIGSEMQVNFTLVQPKMLEEGSRKREISMIVRAMQSSVLIEDEVRATSTPTMAELQISNHHFMFIQSRRMMTERTCRIYRSGSRNVKRMQRVSLRLAIVRMQLHTLLVLQLKKCLRQATAPTCNVATKMNCTHHSTVLTLCNVIRRLVWK